MFITVPWLIVNHVPVFQSADRLIIVRIAVARNAQKRQQGAEWSGGGGAEERAEGTKKALPEQRLMRDYFTC
ncbi:hypothetical protein CA953_02685 [Raoultella ornithinolytica]|nr:hypothetical protein CA210_17345 [Raoultella ornithinolytica]OWP45023.1 hypothetical protein CEG93_03935 [Raoultella ornithinolytica]OZV56221.1 hypothetical protein CA953_02685 [Raoultella ornithinolytica]